MDRQDVLQGLVRLICETRLARPIRVAVDGIDGSGKTTLADELAPLLEERGRRCLRASIDGFHLPQEVRYRRGADSPEGYFLDSFDYEALCSNLLIPLGPGGNGRCRTQVFDHRSDEVVNEPPIEVSSDTVLLFDGVFLQRPELAGVWDLVVFVSAEIETTIRRVQDRDGWMGSPEEVRTRYMTRYLPGQQLYLDMCEPSANADVVVVNDVPENPRLVIR